MIYERTLTDIRVQHKMMNHPTELSEEAPSFISPSHDISAGHSARLSVNVTNETPKGNKPGFIPVKDTITKEICIYQSTKD